MHTHRRLKERMAGASEPTFCRRFPEAMMKGLGLRSSGLGFRVGGFAGSARLRDRVKLHAGFRKACQEMNRRWGASRSASSCC